MRTIALLTDFGLVDNFVGVMKGVMLKVNPLVNFVDLSHNVDPQDIFGGTLLLKSSFKFFSKGTIFLVVIDPGVGSRRKPIIVKTRNYLFVAPDNGVLSFTAKENGIKQIVEIKNDKYLLKSLSSTFHGRDIFAPVAAHLAKGKKLDDFGPAIKRMVQLNFPRPKISKRSLIGEIIYIDRFGNLVTNIDKPLFKKFVGFKKFKIKIKNELIDKLSHSYVQTKPGLPLVIFGSFDFLEISLNKASAKDYFEAKRGDRFKVSPVRSPC